LPDWYEVSTLTSQGASVPALPWTKIYAADELCDRRLPQNIVRTHQILILKRGGCNFSKKLANIPSYAPTSSSLQLVIVVSYSASSNGPDPIADTEGNEEDALVRPYLDEQQVTPAGLPRRNPIPMVLVSGGKRVYDALANRTFGVGVKRRYHVETRGIRIGNLIVV
jgi:hypothetical protein